MTNVHATYSFNTEFIRTATDKPGGGTIVRPPRLNDSEWYALAGRVCALLNKLEYPVALFHAKPTIRAALVACIDIAGNYPSLSVQIDSLRNALAVLDESFATMEQQLTSAPAPAGAREAAEKLTAMGYRFEGGSWVAG